MQVLIDTTIWSLALRKNKKSQHDGLLIEVVRILIEEGKAKIIGPIRQEVLSGIVSPTAYQTLRAHLGAFEDLPILTEDYERAAEIFNLCRSKGIQGSHIDFLICSIALRLKLEIFTTDKDFEHFATYIPINLFKSPTLSS